jgi:hypothetical protein
VEDPETRELRLEQAALGDAEREQADEAESAAEERAHERRAEKHAYLSEKLAERARAEEDSDG